MIFGSVLNFDAVRRAQGRGALADKSFLTGKIPAEFLSRIVFRRTGAPNRRLLLGPALGEDAAIIRVRGKVLVLTTDPITGARENAGWLSVHVNANDVATRGAKPVWFLCCLLLPERSDARLLEEIMSQVHEAAREISVTVAGGHSETTPGLTRPIIAGSMIGEITSGRYVTTSGAKAGDKIILTKTVGLEGTAVLASDLEEKLTSSLGTEIVQRAKAFSRRMSVVKDAMIAKGTSGVRAMHDPTEGGIICGLWELAEASKTGMVIEESKIRIASETEAVCRVLGIDPLRVLSSGALLVAARPKSAGRIVNSLRRHGVDACVIGEITRFARDRTLVKRDSTEVRIEPPLRDELYKVLDESRVSLR
jgi:thiamin-phosphate kinase